MNEFMNDALTEKLKYEEMTKTARCASGLSQGSAGYALNEPCRPSLRERVSGDINRAALASTKLERLLELQHLLEKNPEVSRILDLVGLVRG